MSILVFTAVFWLISTGRMWYGHKRLKAHQARINALYREAHEAQQRSFYVAQGRCLVGIEGDDNGQAG